MQKQRYTLRLSVKTLGQDPIGGLAVEPTLTFGSILVTAKRRGAHFVLQASDFGSEDEAEDFLPRMKRGLWNLALDHNIAFIPFFERRDLTRPEDPIAAGRNLARSFGQPPDESVQPVHGLTEEGGYTIFPSEESIRLLALGDVRVVVSTNWEAVARTLTEGIQQPGPLTDERASGLATSMDLYLTHFYETSIRARLLTLIMALEVLAPATEKHPKAIELLTKFRGSVEAELACTDDPEARDAFEALLREIDFRKESSIRRRLRKLVLDEAPLDTAGRQALAKQMVAAYDLRGALVHTGAIDPQALSEAHKTILESVKLILRGRLGLKGVTPAG